MSPSSSDAEPTVRGPAAGQRVFGRYALQEMLGRGGMGVVWRARDETLGEDVALKFLPDAVRWDPAAFDDLKAETRRARQLTHPNIVRIHDFVEDAGGAAISMELVRGLTLTQLRLATPAKFLEVADIAPWLPQLGAALDYAHTQARVVHRDLKPSNLMLTETGVLKVADFGVARGLADSVTRVSMMAAGTLVYMSPQQAMGDEPSPADDVYALGATLYELLTGKPPFHTGDVRTQLFQRKPDSIASRRRALVGSSGKSNGAAHGDANDVAGGSGPSGGEIPAMWEKTIAACLAKDPAARPATLGEVAAKLALTKDAARVQRPGRRWLVAACGGQKFRRAGLAGVLVLGLGMAGWGWWPATWPEVGPWPTRSKRAPVTRLISQVTFDDSVRDEGGQLENFESDQRVPTVDRHGRIDRAAQFNGNMGAWAEAGPELRWSLRTPFSAAYWALVDVPTKGGASVIVSDPGEVAAPMWRLDLDDKARPAFVLSAVHVENSRRQTAVAQQPLAIGRWTHVAGVSDGVEIRLFVDGEQVARAPIADEETRPPQRARINIGGGRLADRHWFVGALDEMRIYRGALTAVEVRALARSAPARYRRTRGLYGESDDLSAAVRTEFGPSATVADWLELKAEAGPQVTRLADELELITGDNSYFVTRAGQRKFDERRYYNLIRLNGTVPNYYLAHDELGGNVLALGSWYGPQMAVIARVPLPAPRVERVVPGEPLAAGWSLSPSAVVESPRVVARGTAIGVTRERATTGDTVSATWRGWLEGGGMAAMQSVELITEGGEAWAATCETVGGSRENLRMTLGRRGRPERVVEMRPTYGELVFTLVARPGVLRWRVTTAVGGTLVADERVELPGWSAGAVAKAQWRASAEAGAATWLSEIEWREEWSK